MNKRAAIHWKLDSGHTGHGDYIPVALALAWISHMLRNQSGIHHWLIME